MQRLLLLAATEFVMYSVFPSSKVTTAPLARGDNDGATQEFFLRTSRRSQNVQERKTVEGKMALSNAFGGGGRVQGADTSPRRRAARRRHADLRYRYRRQPQAGSTQPPGGSV